MLITTLYERILQTAIEQWKNNEFDLIDYSITKSCKYVSWDDMYKLTDIYEDSVMIVLKVWMIKYRDPTFYDPDWDISGVWRDYYQF